MFDVGGEGGISEHEIAHLGRRDAVLHGKAEDVDQLLAGMADEMRAEDFIRRFIDDDLRGSSFNISNPNSTTTCGCGSSFAAG